jgi:hypothetical protein
VVFDVIRPRNTRRKQSVFVPLQIGTGKRDHAVRLFIDDAARGISGATVDPRLIGR